MPKIRSGCPGQDPAFLKDFRTNIIPCPKCGREVEFFADEKKVKCHGCHSNVFRVSPQLVEYRDGKLVFGDIEKSCLDWCGGCLDKRDYSDIRENEERIEKKKQDLEKLVATVEKNDSEVISFFIEAFRKSINHPKLIDDRIFKLLQKKTPQLFLKARNYYLNFLNS